MEADIEQNGLEISELLDQIMHEEEKKSNKKKKDSSDESSTNFGFNHQNISSEPTIIVRNSVGYASFNKVNVEQMSSSSTDSNSFPHHLLSPGIPQNNITPIHNDISNTAYFPQNPLPIQPIECYGKHCAAVFEPPVPLQNNFQTPQQYSDLNTTGICSVPPKLSSRCMDSPGKICNESSNNYHNDRNKFQKKKKKKRNSLKPKSACTPILPPPPSPPKLLKLSHDSQRDILSPRPFTPPLRPYTPTDPRPFTPPELPFTPPHSQSSSYTNHYPRTPPHETYISHSSIPNKPPEPLEPPPVSPENQDFSMEDSNSWKRNERKRSWDCADENLDDDDNEIDKDRYTNGKSHHKRNYENRDSYSNNKNSNFSHSRGQNNYGKRDYSSKNANNKNNNNSRRTPSFLPLGIRLPGQGDMNAFSEAPFKSVNHSPAFPIMEGMPFPPPGVVFNSMNAGPGFNSEEKPVFNLSLMGERPGFNSGEGPTFNPSSMDEGPRLKSGRMPTFIPVKGPSFNPERGPPFNPERGPPFNSGGGPPFNPGGGPPFNSGGGPPFNPVGGPPFNNGGESLFNSGRGPPFNPGEGPSFNPGGGPSFNPGGGPPFNSGAGPLFNPGGGPPFNPGGVPPFNLGGGPPFNPGGGPPFNPSEGLPFKPSLISKGLPTIRPGPPFTPITEGPFNSIENSTNNLINENSFDNTSNDFPAGKESPFHEEWSSDRNSSRNSRHCKNNKKNPKKKKKKKSNKVSYHSDQSSYTKKRKVSKLKQEKLRKREEEKKLKLKLKKYPNYELEPGEYISDSEIENCSLTSSEASSSESEVSDSSSSTSSSSSSSDTEDSLYKLEFLKKRKPRITRYDKLSDKVSDDESKINDKFADKPKYPRYFKDKVAFTDDTSSTFKDVKELITETEKESSIDTEPLLDKDEVIRPPSPPPIPSESVKTLKTPLIKRLGLGEGKQNVDEHNEGSDFESNEMAEVEIKQEKDRGYPSYSSYSQLGSSFNENVAPKHLRSDSPMDFEEFRQRRSNSLSPNNSLDFEEYKLLESTKEILSASKSIFKSPTSPKATAAKKYEKPIIKVETVSRPSPIKLIKESPQRIDLDSRIKLMFGMKSCGEDNSPEKKNFRNAAFSCKNMRLLSRPPSPFRSRNAYHFWHRETYYFRKNNPIPDVFFDPTQQRIIEGQVDYIKDTFPNVKPDYYQSNDIEVTSIKELNSNQTAKLADTDNKDEICQVEAAQSSISASKLAEENVISSSSNRLIDLHETVTKVDIQPDREVELVSNELEKITKPICENQENTKGINSSVNSDYMVQLIFNKIVEDLKNEIREKLKEQILDEKLQNDDISSILQDNIESLKHEQLEEGFSEKITVIKDNDKEQKTLEPLQSNEINESSQS